VRAFALSSVDSYGQEGAWSAPKVQAFRRLMPSTHVPGAPAWESGSGVYPLVSWVDTGPYHGYSISLRLGAPAGEADLVGRYEIQRASDNGSGGATWTAWERLPDCQVAAGETAAAALIYENRDVAFKPGRQYRYRARAIGLNSTPGLWSETLTVTLSGDSTAPDRPVLGLIEHTGHIELTISPPSIAGGPCPDFSHWKIEGLPQESGLWQVLEPHWCDTQYVHSSPDEGLEKNWKFRVTAYDFSGNASPVSQETGYGKMKLAGTTFLSGVVNQTLAQVAVNQADITLKVSRNGVVSAINLSPESVDIAGRRITLDGDTVFSSDCEIYGILKSVATADAGDRIEISSDGGSPQLRMLLNGVPHINMWVTGDENWGLGILSLYAEDVLGYGGNYGSALCGWYWDPGADGTILLPDFAGSPMEGYTGELATRGRISWDETHHKLKVKVGGQYGTVYTFSPD
ncbi:gp58-like family protein, partial [bacterium]|nr:gp58-like family protein [bacterium]